MNQILYTIEERNNQSKIKSIVLFFGIFLIIFGISITGVSAYSIVSSNKRKQEEIEMSKIPEITLENGDNKAIIRVEHVRNIKDIVYSWISEDGEETDEETISENKASGIAETIEIPAGTNTLHVKVTDMEGKYATAEKEYSYKGTYMDVYVVDNKNLRIKVIDVNGLQSVTYNWNNDEKITEYAEDTDTQTMEIETAIPVGMNTINVTAVNNENEKVTMNKDVQGITKPTIYVTFNSDRILFTMKIKDDQGIESYSYTLYRAKVEDIAENGELIPNFEEKLIKVTSNEVQGNGQMDITDKLELADEFNYLVIRAKNVEGAEEVFSGWCVK